VQFKSTLFGFEKIAVGVWEKSKSVWRSGRNPSQFGISKLCSNQGC
jgi:hypothetical protein